MTPLGPEPGDHDSEVGRGIVTYGEPRFLGVNCGVSDSLYLDDPANPAGSAKASCDPQHYVAMAFSVPVKKEELEAHFSAQVNGKSVDPIGDIPDAQRWGYNRYDESHFNVLFQTPLKADADYTVKMTAGMKDVWGRTMQQGGSAGFHTVHRQPQLDIQEHVAVLEKGVDSEVPVYYTNLDKLSASYTRMFIPKPGSPWWKLGQKEGDYQETVGTGSYDYKLSGVHDLSVGIPLGVRGMLNGQSGCGRRAPHPHAYAGPRIRRQ